VSLLSDDEVFDRFTGTRGCDRFTGHLRNKAECHLPGDDDPFGDGFALEGLAADTNQERSYSGICRRRATVSFRSKHVVSGGRSFALHFIQVFAQATQSFVRLLRCSSRPIKGAENQQAEIFTPPPSPRWIRRDMDEEDEEEDLEEETF